MKSNKAGRYNLDLERVEESLMKVSGYPSKEWISVLLSEGGRERNSIYEMLSRTPANANGNGWVKKVTISSRFNSNPNRVDGY